MPAKLNLLGQRFGKWTVISEDPTRKSNSVQWFCRCDCGTERSCSAGHLRHGASQSCGCAIREKGPKHDLTGNRYGKLTVLNAGVRRSGRHWYWLCQCDCGNQREFHSQWLRASKTINKDQIRSCGCAKKENLRKARLTWAFLPKSQRRLS